MGGKLYSLIGSADGKKYRNFAQGLTFELMVSHANRQLEKMTDVALVLEPLWENALGVNWKQIMTRAKIKELYQRM